MEIIIDVEDEIGGEQVTELSDGITTLLGATGLNVRTLVVKPGCQITPLPKTHDHDRWEKLRTKRLREMFMNVVDMTEECLDALLDNGARRALFSSEEGEQQ